MERVLTVLLDIFYVQVVGQDQAEVHFRVKMSTQMSKLKKSYADRLGVAPSALRFLFDGRRINDDDTPKALVSDLCRLLVFIA